MPLSNKLMINFNLSPLKNKYLYYIEPQPKKVNNNIIWANPQLKYSSIHTQLSLISICQKLESGQLKISSKNDIAHLLEVPTGQLLHIIKNKSKFYKQFPILKKNGGHRIICAPTKGLAILQNRLKFFLEYFYRPKKPAHGFIKGKSIITNANEHIKKRYVVNIDLENYFGTVTFARVHGIFKNRPFNFSPQVASILASLCTYNDTLPQGACTSPILANLVSTSLDKNLTYFSKKNNITYTRYADDITLSFNQEETVKLVFIENNNQINLTNHLISIIENSGFKINFQKVRAQSSYERQTVTGLVVNKKVNINKKYIKVTRAMIHQWQYNRSKAALNYITQSKISVIDIKDAISKYRNHIYGRLSFIKMIRGNDFPMYLKLMSAMARHDPIKTPEGFRVMSVTKQYDVFICYAGEDRESIADPIYNALTALKINTFIDHKGIRLGESITQKINEALVQSQYVIAILSKNSIGKAWPTHELFAVLSREIATEKNHLITVIQKDSEQLVTDNLPLLGGKKYHLYNNDADDLAKQIQDLLSEPEMKK